MELKSAVRRYKVRSDLVRKHLDSIAEEATFAAIEAATDATPPAGDLTGTNTRTGELKAHWATDSTTTPEKRGRRLITRLANGKSYASYVNDGHRMDRHFVPGLYVNPYSDMLEYDPEYPGGIMVGVRTTYVPGLFMAEKGEEAYGKALESAVDELLKDLE